MPKKLAGILVTGKAISVTYDALPAVRMQADLENLGAVTGMVAAMAVSKKRLPHEIDAGELQRKLVKQGLLEEEILNRTLVEDDSNGSREEKGGKELKKLIENLSAEKPLYSYSTMEMGQVYKGKIPFVEVCTAGEEITPLLLEELDKSSGDRKILIDKALAMHGEREALTVLLSEIEKRMEGDSLPKRNSHILYAGITPDQGTIPDVVYLLYAVSLITDNSCLNIWQRVVELFPEKGGYTDSSQGIFYYVDSICRGLERWSNKKVFR